SKLKSSQSTCAIVLAAATVSASVDNAMKSGTANLGAALASPLMTVLMSLGCCGTGCGGGVWGACERAPGTTSPAVDAAATTRTAIGIRLLKNRHPAVNSAAKGF